MERFSCIKKKTTTKKKSLHNKTNKLTRIAVLTRVVGS